MYTSVTLCNIYSTVLKSDLRFQSYNVRDVLTFFMLRYCKAKKVCASMLDVTWETLELFTYPACWIKQHMWGILMEIHGIWVCLKMSDFLTKWQFLWWTWDDKPWSIGGVSHCFKATPNVVQFGRWQTKQGWYGVPCKEIPSFRFCGANRS